MRKSVKKKEEDMRRIFAGLISVLLILSARPLIAQQKVDMSVTIPHYNEIYIADLDVEHSQNAGTLFTVYLHSRSADPLQLRLKLSVTVSLVNQVPFKLADAMSLPFTLDAGKTMTITNLDLSSNNSQIRLDRSNYTFDPENKFEMIKNVALATGKAPAGTYQFDLQCVDASNAGASEGEASGQVIVTNPSRADLLLPMNEESITTLFPHFQWTANSDSVVLSIYERLPNQRSPQDVVSGVPVLQQTVVGTSFNYPPSGPGVRLLENGETYYWFIEIPSSATRGSGLRSDIWSFTETGTDTTSGSAASNLAATKALENLLNGTQYQSLLNQVTTLNGTATFDGSSLGVQDLIDVLQNMDRSKITDVTIQ